MAYVTVINEHQHVQQVVSGHHRLTADEAVSAGGETTVYAGADSIVVRGAQEVRGLTVG